MIPDWLIVILLVALGALVIWRKLKVATPLWQTYSEFGDDAEFERRVVQILSKLPQGFYSSEKRIASRRLMQDLLIEGEVPKMEQRLSLLTQRGILDFHYDKTQGSGPESRLYRLRSGKGTRIAKDISK